MISRLTSNIIWVYFSLHLLPNTMSGTKLFTVVNILSLPKRSTKFHIYICVKLYYCKRILFLKEILCRYFAQTERVLCNVHSAGGLEND